MPTPARYSGRYWPLNRKVSPKLAVYIWPPQAVTDQGKGCQSGKGGRDGLQLIGSGGSSGAEGSWVRSRSC